MWRVLHDNLLKAGGLLASRRRLVAALAVGIEIAFLVFFASGFKGLPQAGTLVTGAVVALVAWTAAVLAGPRVGVVAALSAGVTYGVLVTLPDGSGIAATAGSTVILTFTAYLTGTAADELRHKVLDRETLHATLEQSLLPRLRIDGPPAAVTTLYEPGEERLWLGGDFYDAVRFTDGRVALIVGDVSGRGRRAAALGATLRAGWRALTLAAFPLPATAETLRELLVAELATSETFVTACLALVEPWSRRLTFVNLGHPPPLLLGAAPWSSPPRRRSRSASPEAIVQSPAGTTCRRDGACSSTPTASWRGRRRRGRPSVSASSASVTGLDTGDETAVGAWLQRIKDLNGGPLPDDVAVVLVSERSTLLTPVGERAGAPGHRWPGAARAGADRREDRLRRPPSRR
jgi:hypothetical protein